MASFAARDTAELLLGESRQVVVLPPGADFTAFRWPSSLALVVLGAALGMGGQIGRRSPPFTATVSRVAAAARNDMKDYTRSFFHTLLVSGQGDRAQGRIAKTLGDT
jgi:hypothetical protein